MVHITDIATRWRPSKRRTIHIDNPPPPTNFETYRVHKLMGMMTVVYPDPELTPFLFDKGAWIERTRNIFNNAANAFLKATDDGPALIELLEKQLMMAKQAQAELDQRSNT